MPTKDQKKEIIDDLAKKFLQEKVALFVNIRGIPVLKLNAFRRELKKYGAELKVAKKTLLGRALEMTGVNINPKKLEGELGIIFGYEDQIGTAKLAQKFQKQNETSKILLGLLGKSTITAQEILALAKLPPREVIIAELAGVLTVPIRKFLWVLTANQQNLVVIINKIRDLKS